VTAGASDVFFCNDYKKYEGFAEALDSLQESFFFIIVYIMGKGKCRKSSSRMTSK
jgi:hypothetical protein